MKFVFFCLVLAACFAAGYSRVIYVNTTADLVKAMEASKPGDNIVAYPGKYKMENYGFKTVVGTADKPILLSCSVEGLCLFADSVVLWSCSYLTITGFIFDVFSVPDALTIQDSDHILVNSVTFRGGDDSNVWMVRSSYCTLKYCSFERTTIGINVLSGSDNTIDLCEFGKAISDNVIYINNGTNMVFSRNNVYGGQNCYTAGSWIVEVDAGGNSFTDNSFGFVFSSYQRPLNGYLAKGTCVYGPSTLKNNFMDLKSGTGFAGCKDYHNKVCASNSVVGGATFTDGDVDQSC